MTLLLHRDRELGGLADALAGARSGAGQVVLIEAEAGLGKTALLRAAADEAGRTGMRVLAARASELEQTFAFGCVRQLIEPELRRAGPDEMAALFEGPAALSRRLFDAAAGAGEDPFSILHGLYWLIANLASEHPLALLLDDAHWADQESLRFCEFLASRVDALGVGLIVAARIGEHRLDRLSARRLRPRALGPDAAGRLCERRLGHAVGASFAAACHDSTGGNPFYLEALLGELHDQGLDGSAGSAPAVRATGSASVMRALLLRIAPDAVTLIRSIAVLGDGAALADAAALAGISPEQAVRGADRLVAAAVLGPADALSFAHPILRESVYADIGPQERVELHARAARVLAERGAPRERVAAQLARVPPAADPERAALFARVALDASARGAIATGAAWLSRALAEPPPSEQLAPILLELGIAEHRLGRRDAVEHLRRARRLAADPEARMSAARWLARALTQAGDADDAVRELQRTIDSLRAAEPERALALEADLAYHARYAADDARAEALRCLLRPRTLCGEDSAQRLMLAQIGGLRARHAEDAREARAHLERAATAWTEPAEWDLTSGQGFYDLVIGLLAVDDHDAAQRLVDRARDHAQARGSVSDLAYATCWRGWIRMRRGEVTNAEADARLGLDLLGVEGMPGRRFAVALLIEALVEAGQADAAQTALAGAGLDEQVPPRRASNYLVRAQALLALAGGRTAEGARTLAEFGRREEAQGAASPLATRWRAETAVALLAAGDAVGARQLAREDIGRARRWGTATAVGLALRALALTNDDGPDERELHEAVEVLARSPARLEYARAIVDLGAAQRRSGRRRDAQATLTQATEIADRGGARALAHRARVELRAAGGRSSDPHGTPLARLTASERRIAQLAAQGLSNPQIAQTLFVTRKTVETHLGHVYDKLGISGREHLPPSVASG